MKPFNTIIKKKPLIISLEIILGLSCANLQATPKAEEIDLAAQSEQTEPSQQPKQVKQAVKPEKSEELEAVSVEEDGRAKNLIGIAGSASQGEVSQKQFEYRPLSRNGELVEVVPGAIATQHSGSGKANQYYLRGFNLDHGTDFTTYVDGIPMNMTTHAHGQGYMDINSIIPEMVKNVEYGKGPYYAEVGDFSAAGYAKMTTFDKLSEGIAKFTAGEFDYYRTLVANSNKLGDGDFLYAGEFNLYGGPWQVQEDSKKFNGMMRYTLGGDDWGVSINGKAYTNSWTATNQIPQRAIDNGTLSPYGTMDPTDGGTTNRYSLSSNLWNQGSNWKNDANIYALYSDVALYSNFEGYTDGDPNQSTQILQTERRVQTGGNIEHTRYHKLFGFEMDNSVGLQFRHDEIMGLGLHHTQERQITSTVALSDAAQTTVGTYFKNTTHWHDKVRTIAGLRGDFINNDVRVRETGSGDPTVAAANSGSRGKAMVSPKLSLVIGPWYDTEYFFNIGYGYHSNDARGTTLTRDPASGSNLDGNGNLIKPVNPAAWSRGGEAGIRSNFIPGLNSTFALWWLESSQELVFVGDAGTNEVNGKSHRYGIEWTNYYKPTDWLTLDADYALTTARYAEINPGEINNFVPNSVGRVISTGVTAVAPNGLFGTLRFRHFGSVPLDESGTVWAGDTNVVNLGAGYKHKQYKFEIDVFNLLGSQSNDISYAYCSQLQNEAANTNCPDGGNGTYGMMKHPVEPRMVRGTITINF
ncbi:MAG: TonB-dependent receptor plug domain-containing protein [Methylococcaceae bacterium]|nr:TonB-dependent receptor plug domain-containing protein [Methylococcaceae bacterium]